MWGIMVEIISIAKLDGDSLSWQYTFCFPAPPDAEQISVAKNDQPLDWYWSQEKYLTTVTDLIPNPPSQLQEWPMFAWDITLEPDTIKLTVQFRHKLTKVNDVWVLLYSLGTGRYVEGWNPPIPGMPSGKPFVDVEINVKYPAGLKPLACSPQDEYNPTISFYPNVSWKAFGINPKNDFIVLFRETDGAISYDFHDAGWYLISLPVITADNSLANLFPTAIAAFAWENDQYVSVTNLETHKGYWLAIPSPYSKIIQGVTVSTFTEHYHAGWHLIGSVIDTVDFTNPNDQPDGSVLTPAYGYDTDRGVYAPADTLVPGHGYWIAVMQECDLTIGGETSSSLAKPIAHADREAFYRQFGSQPPAPPAINWHIEKPNKILDKFVLYQNYPNPFNVITVIKFDLPIADFVEVNIYNIVGQRIVTLVNGEYKAGLYKIIWDGKDEQGLTIPAGLYLYKIQIREFQEDKKLLFIK